MSNESPKKKIKTEILDESNNGTENVEHSYEDKISNCSVIAKPMASKKLAKKLFKLIKKANKQKTNVRSGLKEVQSRIRKGETGLVIFAGDVTPIDVMCHMPGVCENKNIPYCYVPSRQDLGETLSAKRSCLMIMVKSNPEYDDAYNECVNEIKHLPVPIN